jgi:uncharacterized RDD family membrane protein YckC
VKIKLLSRVSQKNVRIINTEMPFDDDLIEVVTPERVELSFPIAGIGSRFTAAFLDTLILGLIDILIFVFFLFVLFPLASAGSYLWTVLIAIEIVLYFVISFGYFVYYEFQRNGQTPGKRMMRIRVMKYGGLPVDLTSAMIRNLMRPVDLALFASAIGFLVIFLSKLSQRTGDYVAGTVVIHDRMVSLQDLDKYMKKEKSSPDLYEKSVLGRFRKLSDEDARLIELFMERRHEMDLESRREYASRIASGIRSKVNIKEDEFGKNESLIKTAHDALRAREKGNW